MIRPRVFTILFLFTVTTVGTAFVEAAYGREETARISFRKKIPKETGTWNYVVKKGDHLLEIVRRELGIEQGRHTIIRRYNPHLKNLNKIYPGQIIILPVLAKGDAAPIPIESSPPPKQAGLVTNPSQTPVAEKTIGTIKAVLTRMGITLTAAGRFHIPLPETGEITIDCASIPMADFPDGSCVLMDLRNTLPEDFRSLLEKNWPSFKIVTVKEGATVWEILSQCLNASRAYKMERHEGLFRVGENPSLQLPAAWVITHHGGVDKNRRYYVLTLLGSPEDRVPLPVLAFADRKGAVIMEMHNETVLPPPSEALKGGVASLEPPRIGGASPKDTIFNLLISMGYRPAKDGEVKIFDLQRDGFNLSIKADIAVENDGRRLLAVFRPLPRQFIDILRAKGTDIVTLSDQEKVGKNIAKVLEAMGIPFSTVPYSLPVSLRPALDDVRIILPTIRIAREGSPPLYLVDFDLDGGIYSLLNKELGFSIVRY